MKKVLVAMSGGVDSSVAAYLLKDAGYEVAGLTLELYSHAGDEKFSDAARDASEIAESLGIRHYTRDLRDEFKTCVIDAFSQSYRSGETPNPCILCNKHIKFGRLLDIAKEMGFDYLATGHYAQIQHAEDLNRWLLRKGKDPSKDQSYVLYTLNQEQLSKSIFPLGGMTKNEVREIATQLGFSNAEGGESQDICFIPDGDYQSFLEEYSGIESRAGDFVDMQGNVIGRHRGIIGYTTGQRRGLGVSAERPLYVVRKETATNTVILGNEEDLYCSRLIAREMNFIADDAIANPISVTAKIRYSQSEVLACISSVENGKILVEFEKPQRAATPGQSVVFYNGDTVFGGGVIDAVL